MGIHTPRERPPVTASENPRLYDMHCHLDFAGNAGELAEAAGRAGIGSFTNTVTPRGYLAALEAGVVPAHARGAFALGVGLHPWWLADGSCGEADVALFEELAAGTCFIGEVGLDFAPRREGTFELQAAAFERVARACASGGKLLSIHAVRSADTVLDLLEQRDALHDNTCVFHWFSGSGDELARAVRLGCWFSLGTRSLATKRGRAYARAIPCNRLLLETDWPDDPVSWLDPDAWVIGWKEELEKAAGLMAQARQVEVADLLAQLAANSRRAFAL